MAKTLQERAIELANSGYTIEMLRDRATDGGYVFLARSPELEGCMAQGLTEDEARLNLEQVRIEHIEHLLEFNLVVPPPYTHPPAYPSFASSGTFVKGEYIVHKDIAVLALPGKEVDLTDARRLGAGELMYSVTPRK
jgi:predicted RNase H-like HicB family nuclease